MKDELTFYACDTKVLEEKILTQDLLLGVELAGELERLGQCLGTLYFDSLYMGDVFKMLEEVTGAPFKFLLGMGKRRIEPCGPVSFCGRQVPAELGEYGFAIDGLKKLLAKAAPSEAEAETIRKWNEFAEKVHLDAEPTCLEEIKKFLLRFRTRTPELISVYTRC